MYAFKNECLCSHAIRVWFTLGYRLISCKRALHQNTWILIVITTYMRFLPFALIFDLSILGALNLKGKLILVNPSNGSKMSDGSGMWRLKLERISCDGSRSSDLWRDWIMITADRLPSWSRVFMPFRSWPIFNISSFKLQSTGFGSSCYRLNRAF